MYIVTFLVNWSRIRKKDCLLIQKFRFTLRIFKSVNFDFDKFEAHFELFLLNNQLQMRDRYCKIAFFASEERRKKAIILKVGFYIPNLCRVTKNNENCQKRENGKVQEKDNF